MLVVGFHSCHCQASMPVAMFVLGFQISKIRNPDSPVFVERLVM